MDNNSSRCFLLNLLDKYFDLTVFNWFSIFDQIQECRIIVLATLDHLVKEPMISMVGAGLVGAVLMLAILGLGVLCYMCGEKRGESVSRRGSSMPGESGSRRGSSMRGQR